MSAVFLVVGSKGGAGATTLAVEFANAAIRLGMPATLVDGDLSGRRTMSALLSADELLDAQRTRAIYSSAHIGNLNVVELLDKYENIFALRTSDVQLLATRIAAGNGFIFVDAPRPFDEHVRPFFDLASDVLLIVEPSMLGSTAAQRLLADFVRLGIPLASISVIINTRSGRSEISKRELERSLGCAVIGEIPKIGERNYGRAVEAVVKRLLEFPPQQPFSELSIALSTTATSGASANGNGAGAGGVAVAVGAVATKEPTQEERRDDTERLRRSERRTQLKHEISREVTKRIDVVAASRAHTDGQKYSELREQIGNTINSLLKDRDDVDIQERAELQQEIIDEQLGLGPLEDLMRDDRVSEIMVNGPEMIYVERGGRLTLSDRTFKDERHLRTVIERIVAPLGRRVDESSPMVDARLPDGSRVNAIIEPIALSGSAITIRRFSKHRLVVNDLVKLGSVAQESVSLLRAMVEARLNIVVSGGTGSGKTTFLNILSNFIPNDERILTIEDAAELQLSQDHVVRLESRPANIEGKGAITIRDLVKNSLRMRPDRIIVGECRSGEALDMLQAMNTGHDGSITTLHANTPRDAIARLETLVLMAGFDLPIKAIREQIASAVDVIIQVERVRDGSRKCTSITEIVGMEGEVVTIQEIVRYHQEGIDEAGKVLGHFQYTGVQPHHAQKFEETGVNFDVRDLMKLQSTKGAW
jgi:pilus assembly protein CpaF